MSDGIETCKHCLWDITKDAEAGEWRLGWGDADGENPFDCSGADRHDPA